MNAAEHQKSRLRKGNLDGFARFLGAGIKVERALAIGRARRGPAPCRQQSLCRSWQLAHSRLRSMERRRECGSRTGADRAREPAT